MTTTAPNKLDRLINAECQEIIREEIAQIGGSEVFFVGRLDAGLVIEDVEAYAFGNKRTVPAILQYARPGDVLIHNHPSGHLEPSQADIEIASAMGERGIGSYIVNNDCTEVRIVVKAMKPQTSTPIDGDALANLLAPDGTLAKKLDAYEHRPQQTEMMRAVARAFNEDGLSVIEAGTGTGKSMAYLLPALSWSIRNGEKVVVSTDTINLQEQLIEKDLPLLRQALDLEFDAVLVKGRGNYLCRRKAEFARMNPEFMDEPEKRTQLETIFAWTKTTKDGSLSDLGFTPDDGVWERVMSEADNCLRTKCPFYQNCFFYTARRRAARANVLVVNHHLLMADLAVRAETENYTQSAVLPPFHRIIFDEAHHLEEVATNYFGARVSRAGLMFLLRRYSAPKTGAGLLHFLSDQIHQGETYGFSLDEARKWLYAISIEIMEHHRELSDAVEEAADRQAMRLDEIEGGDLMRPLDVKKRVTPAFEEAESWERDFAAPLRAILAAGRTYIQSLRKLHDALSQAIQKESPETLSPLMELKSGCTKLESQLTQLVRFLSETGSDCRWVEYKRRGIGRRPGISWHAAPLKVADDLRERVLRRYRTVLMTSATLAVEKKFDHFLAQIGANDSARLGLVSSAALDASAPRKVAGPRNLETLLLPAPFDYDKQVYAGVPVDLPSPKEAGFTESLAAFLEQSLVLSRGRGLVLFTSYQMLERCYSLIAPRLEACGYSCLKQGSASRSHLAETLRRNIGSVLFATSSFWEGVDIPGEALSCLILTRLPFAAPGEPIQEARIEAIEAEGRDAFKEFIVPRAVIRFRQGFGRLIRSKTDRGAVLICDRRVATSGFGRTFLQSLPVGKVHVAPTEKVYEKLNEFFSK